MLLKYLINGARFGRVYPRADWRKAIARARVLRANGVAVILKRGRR